MTESFPRQQARTRRFTLGVPRAFQISADGKRVTFLRTRSGDDPVTCLWEADAATGAERLIADPRDLGADERNLPPEELARRERVRELAGGIVSYATDSALNVAVFSLAGQIYAVALGEERPRVRLVPTQTPALDPRPDPTGRFVAYVHEGTLRVARLDDGTRDGDGTERGDRTAGGHGVAGVERAAGGDVGHRAAGGGRSAGGQEASAGNGPADWVVVAEPGVTFGLAEFVAAEEMERTRGYWWSPDGDELLVARVDESPVRRWYIADPANPDRTPAEVGYPAAGTPNAQVTLVRASLSGEVTPLRTTSEAFPYLINVTWGGEPLVVVQSRDQKTMRILDVDGEVIREDTDPDWVDVVTGVPAFLADGRIVWTGYVDDTRRLIIGTKDEFRQGAARPVSPAGLQVRAVCDTDGDTVLFVASAEPTEVALWSYGPAGLTEVSDGPGVHSGRRHGGTTLTASRSLAVDSLRVRLNSGATITDLAQQPHLPAPAPVIFSAGSREIRTAVLLPSWHKPGTKLPVLVDPYGGPHAQRVTKTRGIYLTSQWFAEQGFAVVIADGRGTGARGAAWDRAIAGDLATAALEDQVSALQAAAEKFGDLDLRRVGIRGWSFGGYLSALAVLRRPDVFHAAIAGAPVTDWRLYDTFYTERYLGDPAVNATAYARSSLLDDAERAGTPRPLMLIHGLADDNVVAAHTLRLSQALLAAGYPHSVLPLSGVTHMTPQEAVAENLLLLQVKFLADALG